MNEVNANRTVEKADSLSKEASNQALQSVQNSIFAAIEKTANQEDQLS